jgi:tRNA(fMet)-specific endonuclease VapC
LPYLLDTNIAIHAQDGTEGVVRRCARHEGALFISALTFAELKRGISLDRENLAIRQIRLADLLRIAPVLPFNEMAANCYGEIIAQLGLSRRRDFDRMIAAHAISTKSILVTNNVADFGDIPGLKIEDWT